MTVLFIILFAVLVIVLSRKKPRELACETLSRPARHLYTTIYGGSMGDRPRLLTDREITYWVQSQSRKKLKQIKRYLHSEIIKLKPADWHGYMFNAIVRRSSNLLYFLDENGKATIDTAEGLELVGIQDALQGVKGTSMQYPFTLRTLFHDIFHNVILNTRMADNYYSHGQLKVINLLRSYQASLGLCMNCTQERVDDDWSQLPVFARLARHYQWLEEQRERNWIDINNGFPIIEFDLVRIKQVGVFKGEGTLLNGLFLHLVALVTRLTGSEPQYRSFSEPTHDMRAACFFYSYGGVYIVKYTGITDVFAHRLYVEFANIPPADPLYAELLSMKLHFECNN